MQTTTQRLFLAPDSALRPAWGLAAFSFLPACLAILVHLVLKHFPEIAAPGPAELTPLATFLNETLVFAFLAAQALILSLLERRPFGASGLALPRALPHFAAGLAWGLLLLSTLVATLYFTHSLRFEGFALHGLPALEYAAAWLLAFLAVGLLEEFLFRGYLQSTLTLVLTPFFRGNTPAAFWASAAILSVGLFAWTHTGNGGETPAGIAAVALAGTTFAFSLYRTGSLWWAIGFHTAWDWAQSYFYGTPDSGNLARGHLLATHPIGSPLLSGASAGPEGSVLVLPTLLLACLVIHLTLPPRSPAEPSTLNP